MISTFSGKTASHLLRKPSGVGGRFRRLCQVRTVVAEKIGDGSNIDSESANKALRSPPPNGSTTTTIRYTQCHTSMRTSIGLHNTTKRNYFSSSAIETKNNNDKEKSGLDHHSFFREQMLELENEQKQFGQSDNEETDKGNASVGVGFGSASDTAATSSPSLSSASGSLDLEEQLNDWKSEQQQVFGETLADHDESGPSIANKNSGNNDEKGLEPEEREARFDFSSEDLAAWGKPTPEPNDMRNILEQISLEREKEDSYTKLASLSPPTAEKPLLSTTSSTPEEHHHHHESFSHVSGDGSSVHMVDVGHKVVTPRIAHARSEVWLPPSVLDAFLPSDNSNDGNDSSSTELVGPKGPIFATAKIAGIMACKKTSDLIPLCHPLPLDQVKVDIRMEVCNGDGNDNGGLVIIDCTCKVTHKTGVEMEALTGATVAALTIYDMTKAVSHNIRIQETRLIGKTGGKRTVVDGAEH